MIETIRELPYDYDIHDIAEKVNELVNAVNELSEQQSIKTPLYTVITDTSSEPIVEKFLFRESAEAMYVVRCREFEMVSLLDQNGDLINRSYVED
jgi:hypothetical protein